MLSGKKLVCKALGHEAELKPFFLPRITEVNAVARLLRLSKDSLLYS